MSRIRPLILPICLGMLVAVLAFVLATLQVNVPVLPERVQTVTVYGVSVFVIGIGLLQYQHLEDKRNRGFIGAGLLAFLATFGVLLLGRAALIGPPVPRGPTHQIPVKYEFLASMSARSTNWNPSWDVVERIRVLKPADVEAMLAQAYGGGTNSPPTTERATLEASTQPISVLFPFLTMAMAKCGLAPDAVEGSEPIFARQRFVNGAEIRKYATGTSNVIEGGPVAVQMGQTEVRWIPGEGSAYEVTAPYRAIGAVDPEGEVKHIAARGEDNARGKLERGKDAATPLSVAVMVVHPGCRNDYAGVLIELTWTRILGGLGVVTAGFGLWFRKRVIASWQSITARVKAGWKKIRGKPEPYDTQ